MYDKYGNPVAKHMMDVHYAAGDLSPRSMADFEFDAIHRRHPLHELIGIDTRALLPPALKRQVGLDLEARRPEPITLKPQDSPPLKLGLNNSSPGIARDGNRF